MRYIFIVLMISSVCLFSQATVEVSIETIRQTTHFIVKGKLDLPERNIIIITVHLDDVPAPGSEKLIYVRQGRFLYSLPLRKRILPGNYRIDIIYKKGKIRKLQSVNKYVGDAAQETRIRKEYKTFFDDFIHDISEFKQQIKEQAQQYLAKKPQEIQSQELSQWSTSQNKKIKEFHKLLQNFSSRRVFVPYSYASIKRARMILLYATNIYNSLSQSIELHFGISKRRNKILKEYRLKLLESNIDRLILEIKKHEQLSEEYLNEDSLLQDLAWVNELYGNFSRNYVAQLENFRQRDWQQEQQNFVVQLERFSERIESYQRSPLPGKYPKIISKLQALAKILGEVNVAYNTMLGVDSSGDSVTEKQIEAIQDKVKDRFFALHETIQSVSELKRKSRTELIKVMESALTKVAKLQDTLHKRYTSLITKQQDDELKSTDIESWKKEWRTEIGDVSRDIQVILMKQRADRLQNLPVNWFFFISDLKEIDRKYQTILDRKQDPTTMLSINKTHARIEKMVNNLRSAIVREK